MSDIVLIVLNIILFAMLVLAWQLWRQAVPKRRKVKAVEVADWPSGPGSSSQAIGVVDGAVPAAPIAVDGFDTAPVESPQLVNAGADGYATPPVAAPEFVDPAAPAVATADPVAPVNMTPVAPVAPMSDVPSTFAAPAPTGSVNGAIDDDELAALLDTAPPTSSAPLPATGSPVSTPPAAPVSEPVPNSPSALFSSSPRVSPPAAPAPMPVSSLAPPTAITTNGSGNPSASNGSASLGGDVSQQVGALLAAPRPEPVPVVSSLAAPTRVAPTTPAAVSAPSTPATAADQLRLDITGRPVDDVMRSLSNRLGDMGYSAQTGPSGETVFQRGTTESIRISVSAQESAPTDMNGKPLPGRADVEVVGGQLQETTEAVLFELLDHGFQLRWAVAGELVLSSFDGALARVNVNPTTD